MLFVNLFSVPGSIAVITHAGPNSMELDGFVMFVVICCVIIICLNLLLIK